MTETTAAEFPLTGATAGAGHRAAPGRLTGSGPIAVVDIGSNSVRLVEVAQRSGVCAELIQRADDIRPEWLAKIGTLGLTAGASAPEELVREVVARITTFRPIVEETVITAEEKMVFKLPRQLID